jgi:PAS domain S-box-containing protein
MDRLDETPSAALGRDDVDRQVRDLHAVLLESEARFRTMADGAPVLLWMAGIDSLCNFFNEQWLRFTGRTMEEEVGTGWAEGVHPEDLQSCMDTYLGAFVARKPFRMEYRLRRSDGQYRWLLDQGLPRYAPGGAFSGYIGSCVDITELREATEAQRRISKELEVLIKEIHHRVKNNLQVIMSILNLQMRHVTDSKALDFFRDTQGRVRSIALLHERLYQSKSFAHINALDYLTGVLASIRATLSASAPAISIDLRSDGIVLPIDTAIPFGLIVNELVTNAFKYAFISPSDQAPKVHVLLSRATTGGGLELVVGDNGTGVPEDLNHTQPTTLGLQLVRALVRQISGDLSLSTANGTKWTIRTPPPNSEDPDARLGA